MPVIIAEIGCNHKGDMEIAHEMIKMAALFCKADVVKFQKRNPRALLTEAEYNTPHPNPMHSFGATYGEHREFLEFDLEQHKQLQIWCKDWGIGYSSSVWDIDSARDIISLQPNMLKIPSAANLDFEMMEYIAINFPGIIHISLGMTTQKEEERIISFFDRFNRTKDVVIYHCVSGYPVPMDDVCLMEITRLKQAYGKKVKAIGFSGHHLGISVDIGAMVLGAEYFERHFTLDRTWKGTDHAASLEPDGLRRLTRDLRAVDKTMKYKPKEILDIELVQRKKLKRKIGEYDIK
ncbi:MAG TPA: N-acetylneuraminate synthase [Candidatus Margulisbacteria bacterium]|nr:MAG: N-acetylneuraminate synthase [Bacteroidetes bacterium GWF2_43_11]OGH99535.1 MAG: N-acetylneuraminate synthase [Candidatus Margulisbacteria bacterium GWD2_39_127]HAR62810.1 N-acetylneuraminate synthase [Candidatus Margulisiibacteriota bacterium]HCT86557.1 N-acetylneuraminate synthase [Candidatus Margulisiibacteriota bacterium]